MNNRFPASRRLKSEKDFKAVFAHRDIFRGERLIFYRKPHSPAAEQMPLDDYRFGFVVSKKCGNAVRRNRIKRVLREIVRTNMFRIPVGFDYILRVKPEGVPDGAIGWDEFIGDFEQYFGWN